MREKKRDYFSSFSLFSAIISSSRARYLRPIWGQVWKWRRCDVWRESSFTQNTIQLIPADKDWWWSTAKCGRHRHTTMIFFGSNEMINYLQHRQKKPRGSLMWHKSNEASIKLNINSFLLSHTHTLDIRRKCGEGSSQKNDCLWCVRTLNIIYQFHFVWMSEHWFSLYYQRLATFFSSSLGDSSLNDKIGTSS